MTVAIYKYFWQFGDGQTSDEKSPLHTYRMPGKYHWTLTVTDEHGNTASTDGYVYVYDFDYGGAFDVSNTDKSYRAAVQPFQGRGISPYTGEHWLWPTAYTGTCRGYDKENNAISLVCNNRNGRFYRIGIPELWTDRTDSYGGDEIGSKLKLKERTAPVGEFQEIEHVEDHLHIRPWNELNYRNAIGYTAEGFRTNHAVSVQIYENGEPTTPATKIEEVPRYGDYVFRKRIEARRLQIEYIFATAAWRIVMAQEHYMPIDKKSGPAFDYPQEEQWQHEFRQALLWLSRDRLRPTTNRATGTVMTGDYDQLTTGPDNQLRSALAMGIPHSLSTTLASITGDMTISMWLGAFAIFPGIFFQCSAGAGTLLLQINTAAGVRSVIVNDGVNGFSRQLSWTGGWVYLVIQRSGANILIYENGVKIYQNPMIDSTIAYGGAVVVANGIVSSMFDIRVLTRAVSAGAIAYYYDQIVNHGKNNPFLPILR